MRRLRAHSGLPSERALRALSVASGGASRPLPASFDFGSVLYILQQVSLWKCLVRTAGCTVPRTSMVDVRSKSDVSAGRDVLRGKVAERGGEAPKVRIAQQAETAT